MNDPEIVYFGASPMKATRSRTGLNFSKEIFAEVAGTSSRPNTWVVVSIAFFLSDS
jgi:hypothetical protein